MTMQRNLVIIKSCISRQHCLLLTCKKSVQNKQYIKRVYKKYITMGSKVFCSLCQGFQLAVSILYRWDHDDDQLIVRIDDDDDDDGGGGGV